MKKILALAASPNKWGNSDTLLDIFIEGIKEYDTSIEVEKVYLYDIPMAWYDHAHKRPTEDEKEFQNLCEQIQTAHGLIIATPTYNFSLPGNLKNFVDRIGFCALDYKTLNTLKQPTGQLGHLTNFYIVTGGSPSFFAHIAFMLFPTFILWIQFLYYGVRGSNSAFAGELTFTNPAKDKPKLLKKFKKLGTKYAKKINKK